jgi:hypothetical protein
MLSVFLIIAIFTMVWTVGRGIADEKNRREGPNRSHPLRVAIRCQAVVRGESCFHRRATGGYGRGTRLCRATHHGERGIGFQPFYTPQVI